MALCDTKTQLEEAVKETMRDSVLKTVLEEVVDPQYIDNLIDLLKSLCDEKHIPIDRPRSRVITLLNKSSTRFLMQKSMTIFESLFHLYYSIKCHSPSRIPKMKDDIMLLKREVAYHKQLWTDVIHDVEDNLAETERLWHHRMETLDEATD